ncbi:hypothetical protein J6590_004576 [Homalodisca vitripennis]|nr:hypothetical protein J6590_004576 [Homalodisca vitripennis]
MPSLCITIGRNRVNSKGAAGDDCWISEVFANLNKGVPPLPALTGEAGSELASRPFFR